MAGVANPRLILPTLEGMTFESSEIPLKDGLHVIVGRNNAGKSRFMNAVVGADIARDIPMLAVGVAESGSAEAVRLARSHADADTSVRSSRGGVVLAIGSTDETFVVEAASVKRSLGRQFVEIVLEAFNRSGNVEPSAVPRAVWNKAIAHLEANVVRSRATASFQSNRHFPCDANLNSQGSIQQIDTWPSLLASLRDDEKTEGRARWEWINLKLGEVTGGLKIELRGSQARRTIYVIEPGTDGLRLDQCGDGLRDLIALLMLIVLHPNEDLFIEEPGIRLHPGAQRRLLHILEEAAKNRSVWVTTHDGVFAGASSAVARYSVRRENGVSEVRGLATLDELRDANIDLGWQPGDAFLTERVIYCEGPSDKILLEAMLKHLEKTDATFGGVRVCDLGGSGVVWGKDRTSLKNLLELLRRVAPHARQTVVLDGDGKFEREREALEKTIRDAAQLDVRWVHDDEVEAFYLEPTLVKRIVDEEAKAAGVADEIDMTVVEETLSRLLADEERGKPSAIIGQVCEAVHLRNDKVQWAKTAARWMERDAPEKFKELVENVRNAVVGSGLRQ
jgi:hypothetical protein